MHLTQKENVTVEVMFYFYYKFRREKYVVYLQNTNEPSQMNTDRSHLRK